MPMNGFLKIGIIHSLEYLWWCEPFWNNVGSESNGFKSGTSNGRVIGKMVCAPEAGFCGESRRKPEIHIKGFFIAPLFSVMYKFRGFRTQHTTQISLYCIMCKALLFPLCN
jgi:hypothetical protein